MRLARFVAHEQLRSITGHLLFAGSVAPLPRAARYPRGRMSTLNRLSVIGIGASAGGVEAMRKLFRAFAEPLNAAVLVVLHVPPHSPSQLASILGGETVMPVKSAEEDELLRPGHVYVAVPDRHLLVKDNRIRLSRGPKECRVRPAIDVLFRSLSVCYGPRAAGVVLSGMLDDGTAGLWAIKEQHGRAFVQDLVEAQHSSMPQSAVDHVKVDVVAPVGAIAQELAAWCNQGRTMEPEQPNQPLRSHAVETDIALEANALRHGVMDLGHPSKYTCPDCHGVLVEIREGSVVRYRCHTGHAFSIKTLLAEVDTAVDNGLWDTIRAMEERFLLLKQLSELASQGGRDEEAQHYQRLSRDLEKPIETLRSMVLDPRLFGHETAK